VSDVPLSQALIGSWGLVSREDRTASGERRIDPGLGADPIALLVYDRGGNFAAQFMKRDRTHVENVAAAMNNTQAKDGYDAYFGEFDPDEATGMVQTRLIGALSRDHVGKVLARRMLVTGDTLTIELDTSTPSGEPVKRTLTWKRVG